MIEPECISLLVMAAVGAGAGLFYDFLRGIRHALNAKKAVTAVIDFIYWAVVGTAVWYAVLCLYDGRVRGFEIFGLILGAVLYFMTLSRLTSKIFLTFFKLFLKILLTPARFLYRMIVKVKYFFFCRLRRIKATDEGCLENAAADEREGHKNEHRHK